MPGIFTERSNSVVSDVAERVRQVRARHNGVEWQRSDVADKPSQEERDLRIRRRLGLRRRGVTVRLAQPRNVDDIRCDTRPAGRDCKGEAKQRRETGQSQRCKPPIVRLDMSEFDPTGPNSGSSPVRRVSLKGAAAWIKRCVKGDRPKGQPKAVKARELEPDQSQANAARYAVAGYCPLSAAHCCTIRPVEYCRTNAPPRWKTFSAPLARPASSLGKYSATIA